jgi:diadenylate cyclase
MELFTIGPIPVTTRDLWDLFLTTLIVYGVLWWFRRNGLLEAALVLLGMLFLLRLLSFLELPTLSLLVRYIFSASGILVAFWIAPELRRDLMKIRNLPLLRRLRGEKSLRVEVEQIIEELLEAIETFRRQQLGALIVIEGQDDLTPYAQSGDPVQMPVRAHILVSLFQKQSPLHDGAAIIRQDKIIAVRCMLPLSEKLDLPPSYGTRHRAGIGLSEATDALVLIVSEETGYLSLVHRGQVERPSPQTLRERLLSHYLR